MAKKDRRRLQEILGDGRGATIWFQAEKLDRLDELCAAANCSRSWMVNQIIENSGIMSLIEDDRVPVKGANSDEK